MKSVLLVTAILAAGAAYSIAFAQQPPVDPQVAVYRQLLDNADAQLAQAVANAQTQIADLQKQLAAERAKSTNSAEASKP